MPPRCRPSTADVAVAGVEPRSATRAHDSSPGPSSHRAPDAAIPPARPSEPMVLSVLAPGAQARRERLRRQALASAAAGPPVQPPLPPRPAPAGISPPSSPHAADSPPVPESKVQSSHTHSHTHSHAHPPPPTPPASASKPRPRPPAPAPATQRLHLHGLATVTPAMLYTHLLTLATPECRLHIPHVTRDELSRWEALHGLAGVPEQRNTHGLRVEFDAARQQMAVRLMASPVHDAVGVYFGGAAGDGLARALLPRGGSALMLQSLGITITTNGEMTGFTLPGLAHSSKKIPDFSLLMGWDAEYPVLVAEVGWTEDAASLMCDAELCLLGTEGRTKVVILVDLVEDTKQQRTTDAQPHPDQRWPEQVPKPTDVGNAAAYAAAERLLTAHLLKDDFILEKQPSDAAKPARQPLVGRISATASVHVRREDAEGALRLLRTTPTDDDAPSHHQYTVDPNHPDLACVYSYQFMRDGNPVAPDPASSKAHILRIPLGLILASPADPSLAPLEHPGNGTDEPTHLEFNLHDLASVIAMTSGLRMKKWRAVGRARALLASWAGGAAAKTTHAAPAPTTKAKKKVVVDDDIAAAAQTETTTPASEDLVVGGTSRRSTTTRKRIADKQRPDADDDDDDDDDGVVGAAAAAAAAAGGLTTKAWKRTKLAERLEDERDSDDGCGEDERDGDDDDDDDDDDEEWAPPPSSSCSSSTE